MSSSDRRPPLQVTAWSLDELEMPDVFTPLDARDIPSPPNNVEVDSDKELLSPQELAHVEAAAYARGRADGDKLARTDVLPRLESALVALSQAMETVRVHQARWMANVEENIAVVAVITARHIISREVQADATIVAGLVQRALSHFPLDHTITVRLHPEDCKACEEHVNANRDKRGTEVRWAADPLIQRGGALVEGRERIIDGRVDTALERVYHKLGNLQA